MFSDFNSIRNLSSYKMLVQVFAFSILVALGSADTDVETDTCCKNYNDTYVVSNDYQNWYQALINCESAGMQLATINSKEDNDNLQKFLTENNYTLGYWLGATNLGNGNYYWATTGQVVVYTDWIAGQPDHYDTERCLQWGVGNVSVSTDVTYNGWNNQACDSKIAYICEKEPCCGSDSSKSICWCQA